MEEEIPEYEEETDDVIDDENDLKTTDDDEIEEQDEVEDPKKKRGWLCFYVSTRCYSITFSFYQCLLILIQTRLELEEKIPEFPSQLCLGMVDF